MFYTKKKQIDLKARLTSHCAYWNMLKLAIARQTDLQFVMEQVYT